MRSLVLISIIISLFSCSSSQEREVLEKIDKYDNQIASNHIDTSSYQNKEGYVLEWELAKDEIIGYEVILEVIGSSDIDFGMEDNDFFKEKMEEIREEMEQTTYLSTISHNKRGKMEVKMFTEGYKDKEADKQDEKGFNMSQMMKGVQLRGEINKKGKIESFYIKETQRNLLAMYYQLPEFPVKVSDSWSLDVHYLQMDHNFICDSATNRNNVQLIELQKEGQDTIAIIRYDILQFAEGTMKSYAMMGNNNGEVSILMKFNGIGEFSISQGKWILFDGILETVQDGAMRKSSRQHLGLRPLEEITEEMKNVK
jgi:hypothetical protein